MRLRQVNRAFTRLASVLSPWPAGPFPFWPCGPQGHFRTGPAVHTHRSNGLVCRRDSTILAAGATRHKASAVRATPHATRPVLSGDRLAHRQAGQQGPKTRYTPTGGAGTRAPGSGPLVVPVCRSCGARLRSGLPVLKGFAKHPTHSARWPAVNAVAEVAHGAGVSSVPPGMLLVKAWRATAIRVSSECPRSAKVRGSRPGRRHRLMRMRPWCRRGGTRAASSAGRIGASWTGRGC